MTTAAALTWERLAGLAHEIALGADGSAWCLGLGDMPDVGRGGGYSIHRWNGADWDHVEGAADKLAAGRGVGFQPATSRGVGFQPATSRGVGFQPAEFRGVGFQPAEFRGVGFQPATNRPQIETAEINVEPDLNDGILWATNREHRVLRRSAAGWELLPGIAREIAVGADGSAWCLSASDFAPGGASIHVWNGRDWDHVDGAAVKIAVGPDGQPWIVNSAGNIFRRSGEGWELLPGLAREIAIGADGSVWCLCAGAAPSGDSSIHVWSGFDWDHVPGAAAKIAAGAPGAVWLVNGIHQIFRGV